MARSFLHRFVFISASARVQQKPAIQRRFANFMFLTDMRLIRTPHVQLDINFTTVSFNAPIYGVKSDGVGKFGDCIAVSPKRCEIGPQLLLLVDSKSHMYFPLVTKSTSWVTLDDLLRQLHVIFYRTFWESTASNQMKLNSYYLRQKCSLATLVTSSYASAVLAVVIVSVCPCFVTKPNDALKIFWYHTNGQSL